MSEIDYPKLVNQLEAEIDRLRAENVKVSAHCATLISELKIHGVSDERLKALAMADQVDAETALRYRGLLDE